MQPHEELTVAYFRQHPEDAARHLDALSPPDAAALLSNLPCSVVALVLEALTPAFAAEILHALPQDVIVDCIASMSPPLAIRALRCCDHRAQQAIVNGLKAPIRMRFRRAVTRLRYIAGDLADPRVLTTGSDVTAAEALGRMRQHPQQAECYVYVVDRSATLIGVVTMKALVVSESHQRVESIMTHQVRSLFTDTPFDELLHHPHWKYFSMLPVIGRTGIFVGALHHHTLRAIEDPPLQHVSVEATLLHTLLTLWELYAVVGAQLMTGLASAFAHTDAPPAHTAILKP